ncbi:competence/damage-inducible protein A [Mangrovibacterium marinum]|uniref:CinA-like protein n=1 Tax=Mangrovibacterium marinum TaxID=1639118 RepID=A0A2T5C087_9BACT|nr:competence/damage-inducible protein A [Mangrovibacterium marinum]PTN08005.1 nicotinamide-nucleotide amidase [Mangrovibacterium marinum]
MKAEIITIGDEILIGQIVDTNSAWMAEQLNLNGIEVYQVSSVHDDHKHILQALADAQQRADLVLITGGLGPTKDDITKKCLCEYFNCGMHTHQPSLQAITERLEKRGIALNQLNRDQALVPDSCTVLPNKNGTAPGMWFEKQDTIFVSMPGVPYEMTGIMEDEVFPRLRKSGKLKSIYHQTILVYGIGESTLSEMLENWENALPPFIKLAYLPNQLMVRLRLSAYGTNSDELKQTVDQQIGKLQELIPDHICGYNGDTLSEITGKLLTKASAMVAVAESCTGGNIAHLYTEVPGSSSYFKGGVVAYSNDVKMALLNVKAATLDAHGAVSQQTALEMVAGVKQALGSDYGIATTGIAGPDGGTSDKPVGTVWIAVSGKHTTRVECFRFHHNRSRNIERASQTALNMLRQLLLTEINEAAVRTK